MRYKPKSTTQLLNNSTQRLKVRGHMNAKKKRLYSLALKRRLVSGEKRCLPR